MLRLLSIGFIAIVIGTAPCMHQTGAGTKSAPPTPDSTYIPTMTFDVASVRENKNIDAQTGMIVSGQFAPNTTSARFINWEVYNLISFAYGVDHSGIVGAPKWPFPSVFMIEAKGDSEADARMSTLSPEQQKAERQHMLQKLLEDRFQLKTHWESKEGDVYNLVATKSGPRLGTQGSIPPSGAEKENFGDRPIPAIYQKNDGDGYDFIAHSCTMGQLVEILTGQFGRPVVDHTGLTGKYDFILKYRGRWDRDRDADDQDPTPPMDRALEEELGLKVEASKGSMKVLVIDHIEKPSEN